MCRKLGHSQNYVKKLFIKEILTWMLFCIKDSYRLEWHYKIDLVRGFQIIRDLQKHVERINTVLIAGLKVMSELNICYWIFIVDQSWIFNIRVPCGTPFSRNGELLLFLYLLSSWYIYMFIMEKGSSLFEPSSVYIWSLVSDIVSTYIFFSMFWYFYRKLTFISHHNCPGTRPITICS